MTDSVDRLAIVCGHVLRMERDVRLAVHHVDDSWQAVCGEYDHPDDCDDFGVVHLSDLIERQASLMAALDIPMGYMIVWTGEVWKLDVLPSGSGPGEEKGRVTDSVDRLAIVCGHVLRMERDVRLAVHHADDSWQAVCGEYDHPDDCGDFGVVHLSHLIERQASLVDALDIPMGYMGEWTGEVWKLDVLQPGD